MAARTKELKLLLAAKLLFKNTGWEALSSRSSGLMIRLPICELPVKVSAKTEVSSASPPMAPKAPLSAKYSPYTANRIFFGTNNGKLFRLDNDLR